MKTFIILTYLSVLNLGAYSQVENIQLGADLSDAAKLGSRQTGFESLQSHSSGIVSGSQFFFPTWAAGTITTIVNNETIQNYLFLLDKVRGVLYIKLKTSTDILLADKSQIKSFTIITNKQHYFVPASTIDSSKKEGFFEILVNSPTGFTLLKMVKTNFIKASNFDMEKMKKGENEDAFIDDISYYIIKNNLKPQLISLKENSIKKVLASSITKVNIFLNENREELLDEAFLIGLVQSIN